MAGTIKAGSLASFDRTKLGRFPHKLITDALGEGLSGEVGVPDDRTYDDATSARACEKASAAPRAHAPRPISCRRSARLPGYS